MPDQTDLDKLNAELETRLDELFREEDAPAPQPATARAAETYPLAELKKLVLSIDWEITPKAIDDLLDQIRLLKEVYRREKSVSMLLQILGSLGQYVKTSRSRVHPNTFSVLNSVFTAIDEIVTSPRMTEQEKRKRLQVQTGLYQQLRQKIQQRRAEEGAPAAAAKSPTEVRQPSAPTPQASSHGVTAEDLERAIRDLKAFIRSELKALRDELK